MLGAWLAAAAIATAAVTFERTPEGDEKEALEPDPQSVDDKVQRTWRLKAQRRAVWAGIDAAVRAQADAVDACARAGTLAVLDAVEAELTFTVDVTGMVKVRGGSGADPVLAACVVTLFDGKALPVVIQRSNKLTYTVRWDGKAPVPAAPAPAGEPTTAAFAPLVDAERGFGVFYWGARAADYELMTATGSLEGSTFYSRVTDHQTRWFGVPIYTVRYAFGKDGFYAVSLGISGTTAQWQMRETLVARYGPSKWDTRANAYYWRGERALVQLQPVPGGDNAVITLLDIERARASGLAERLPGDRDDPTGTDSKRRMPRIFKDDP